MTAPPTSVPAATSMYGSGQVHQQPLLQASSVPVPNIVPGGAPSGAVPMAMSMGVVSAAGGVVTSQASSSSGVASVAATTAAPVGGPTAIAGGGAVSATPSPGLEKKMKKKKVHCTYFMIVATVSILVSLTLSTAFSVG